MFCVDFGIEREDEVVGESNRFIWVLDPIVRNCIKSFQLVLFDNKATRRPLVLPGFNIVYAQLGLGHYAEVMASSSNRPK